MREKLFASFIFIFLNNNFSLYYIIYIIGINGEDQSPWSVTKFLRQIHKSSNVSIMLLAKIELSCLPISIANRSGAACYKFLSVKLSVIALHFLLKMFVSTGMQILIYILNYLCLNPST